MLFPPFGFLKESYRFASCGRVETALGAHPVRGKGSAHPPEYPKVANLLSA